jgi:hypothetical protein
MAILAAAATLAAGTATAAVRVGLGDQAVESLGDPRFAGLGITTARIVVPWNIVDSDPWRLALWVNDANARGIEPLVALGHAASDHCPASPCVLPTVAQYRDAFVRLHAVFPTLRLFVAWNEPNHAREPTAGDPAAAARYADTIADVCPACGVVAGDVLDAPGMLRYLALYRQALTIDPLAWGLHNYYDTTYFRPTGTEAFLAAVQGPVWLTESGGIVTWRSPDGAVQLPYDEQRAAASLSYGLRLAADHADRIERMYVYQWQAGPADDFDAGLIRADGSERPALAVLRSALGASDEDAGGKLVAPPTSSAQLALGRIRMTRAGRLRVVVECRRGRCRGRLTVEGTGRIAEQLVNGRTRHGTLAPRRARFDLLAGSGTIVRVRLPRSVLRRAGHSRLLVRVTAAPSVATDFVAVRRNFKIPRSLQP